MSLRYRKGEERGDTEIEQKGHSFRGIAEGGRGKINIEVCGEFEDFGVVCYFEQISSADKDCLIDFDGH